MQEPKILELTRLIIYWEQKKIEMEKSLDFLMFSEDIRQKQKYIDTIPQVADTIKFLTELHTEELKNENIFCKCTGGTAYKHTQLELRYGCYNCGKKIKSNDDA